MRKILWPIFARIIEHDKCQGTNSKGPDCNLTSSVQAT